MIYVKEEDKLKKYQIEIDKENLESLKYKIINDCSIIKHIKQKEEEKYLTGDLDFIHVKNYRKRFVERIDNNDFYGPPMKDIYEEEYDYYEEPDVIKIIEEVLKGNENKTLELLNYEVIEEPNKNLEEKLSELMLNTKSEESLIYEAKKLLEEHKNTTYQKSVSIYLEDVKNCIRLLFVDEISYEEYMKVCKFIYFDEEKILSNIYKKNK